VASVHNYKRFENNIVLRIGAGIAACARSVGSVFKAIGQFLIRRYTLVFVPHSEKKVYNFHVSILSVACFFLVLTAMIGAFFWYGASYKSAKDALTSSDARLKDTQASIEQIRDEVEYLFKEVRNFQPVLSSTLEALGADVSGTSTRTARASAGDLPSVFDVRETPANSLREVDYLRQISEFISSAVTPIKEVASVIGSQGAVLTEIPSIWPVQGGIGHISLLFGQQINPFTGQYYIHRGIDISTFRQGDPVIATADGQVVFVGFERDGFGNNVVIRHSHGFFSRYAHLLSFRVRNGQKVQQGEVIGYIGNTGLSTGPHLHYEVHIGSDVVNPYNYLNLRPRMASRPR